MPTPMIREGSTRKFSLLAPALMAVIGKPHRHRIHSFSELFFLLLFFIIFFFGACHELMPFAVSNRFINRPT
jgi:hypothetical protein